VLQLPESAVARLVGHCYDGLPDEACALLGGHPDGRVVDVVPCTNADRSSRTYSIDGRELLGAERRLEERGLELIGVAHSHTHTEAYPSPTDVERAALLESWHFVIVSLRPPAPSVRSYRIVDATVAEEPITVLRR
jgi:proteasome lid subunit RPN8/RPN11